MQNNNQNIDRASRTRGNQPHFKKKKSHKGAWISLIVFLVLVVTGLIIAHGVYVNMKNAADKAYQPGYPQKKETYLASLLRTNLFQSYF